VAEATITPESIERRHDNRSRGASIRRLILHPLTEMQDARKMQDCQRVRSTSGTRKPLITLGKQSERANGNASFRRGCGLRFVEKPRDLPYRPRREARPSLLRQASRKLCSTALRDTPIKRSLRACSALNCVTDRVSEPARISMSQERRRSRRELFDSQTGISLFSENTRI